MKPQDAGNRSSSVDQGGGVRNPFGVMDVPDPNDQQVLEFAAEAELAGTSLPQRRTGGLSVRVHP